MGSESPAGTLAIGFVPVCHYMHNINFVKPCALERTTYQILALDDFYLFYFVDYSIAGFYYLFHF